MWTTKASSAPGAESMAYETYQLNAQDDDWKEKILQRAKAVQEKERRIREQAPSF